MPILKANSNRAYAVFAADYEPQLDFQVRLPAAAEACRKKFEFKHWSIGPAALLRDIEQRVLLSIDHRRVALFFLGIAPLQADLNRYSAVARLALEKMAVRKIKKMAMKTQLYLSLKMSHDELVQLMFDTFFASAKGLEALCGKVDDGLVQFHGNRGGMKLIVLIGPVTGEQASNSFMALPHLEHFLEPKLFDTGVKDFKDRIAEDGLVLDIDLSRIEADPEDVPFFFSNALQESDALADGVVRKLKALPPEGDH